ncbi:MAG: hypothetical protein RLY16_1708, partial [Bacteroidota bacterium]
LAKLGGHGYDLLILLNRFINWILSAFGAEKMSLSKKIKNGVKKAVAWIDNFEQTAAELAIQKKYDYVACGHIHQPQQRIITTKNGSVTYLNSGDWVENLTALEYNQNEWTIYQHQPAQFDRPKTATKTTSKKLPEITVETDVISLFLNTLQTHS